MKKSKFFKRVIAFVLVLLMMVSLLPLSVMADVNKFDIVTDRNITYTGIDNQSLNTDDAINWPIKIYDYLADGMLFEFAQADGSVMYSSNKVNTDDYTGQYVLGKPMPPTSVGHDFTNDYVYTGQQVNIGYETETNRYVKNKMPAVDYQSPQYMRITSTGKYPSNFSTNMNCCIANFTSDNGGNKAKNSVRYVTMVYRAGGIANSGAVPGFALNVIGSSGSWLRFPSNDANLYDVDGNAMTNTSEWKVFVADLATLNPNNWTSLGDNIATVYLRLVQDSLSDYFDISHIGFFSTEDAAKQYGEQCLAFIKEPGEYISGTYWNGAGNDGFGMLYPSNGAAWNSGGGNPLTSTNGGTYAAYYTQAAGGVPSQYESEWSFGASINANRKTGKDANGRYNGTGNLLGTSDMIYLIQPKTFARALGTTDYNLSELQFDGYNLLTTSTKGVFTAGLLEGTLGVDGTPQYRQEAVEYIADMLSKTLVIPRRAANGNANYSFVAGVKNREQYGYSVVDGKEVANDLAQALRNCLDIYFTGNTKAAAPQMGTYAETLKKADKLKGAFLTVSGNIDTCMDAAYYLLNNLFVANSYNQEQDDYRYLTLTSAKLSSGQNAYVFDGGFSNGASLDAVANGTMTQDQYKALSDSAIEYSSRKNGGKGTISISKVDEKDYFYYSANATAYTTMYPFLPVTGATGVYAGGTDSYYFAEDGKRSYTDEFGTYKNRNYNYVLASNGEFVYHEEDNLFFEFEGDDDVYLFINGQLVLDLGGGHSVSSSALNVNDYVTWARDVLKNPGNYSETEIARAEALDLTNGEIASFDFYYMERHGYGANMRIATNMHITDPLLRAEKSAYQGGKQIEYGGIVDAKDSIEYNFKLTNIGNTKLYNLTFDDADIGVSLTPEKGLFVVGDDGSLGSDPINGYYVTDARGERLDAEDLTAVVSGYQNVGTGGNYIQSAHTYTRVADGAGTHIYYDGITINFADNNALKNFLKTLQSENTDGTDVDDEQTQRGSGLWVDATVTFKGIYYKMNKDQKEAGMFDNTVYVTGSTRIDLQDASNETRRSEARHRVYVTAIPSYYQWAGHNLFMSKKRVLDDASAEAGNESSMLHDYIAFFNKVNGDISKFGTKFCDRLGNVVADDYYENVSIQQAKDGQWGYVSDYSETGIYEFFLLMYLYGASGLPSDLSTLKAGDLNLGDYAIVRVLVIVADVEDSEYVLDYGLTTENLDAHGELFKNDELYGSLSGTKALLMGFTNQDPSYRDYKAVTDYNRIDFNAQNLEENNKFQTEDGYYSVNVLIPETGKQISYDDFSGMYTLTETGTTKVNVECPVSWGDLYLYYWYDNGRNNVWPGEKMTKISHGNYEMAIPDNAPHIIISNGTNQTVDLHLNTGQEAWIDIPGTLNDDEKLYATVEYKSADGIIHAKVPEGWGDVYVYCWDSFDHGLDPWPGTKVENIDADGFYTYTIPGDITNVIVNNGDKGKQTDDLIVYAGSETWITVNSTPTGENTEMGITYYGATSSRSTETVTMHAKVPSDWQGASIYYWNSNGSATGVQWPGLAMTKDADGLYHIEGIPADVTNVIINDGNQNNAKQTHNLSITPGVETWFNVTVKSGDGETKIRAEVPADWGNTHIYFFNDAGPVGTGWPGAAATKQADGTYTATIPDGATKYVVNNNNGVQTQDLKIIRGSVNDIVVRGNNDAVARTATKLHIAPENGWSEVYVHYWNSLGGGTTMPGEKATKNDDGTFSFTIPVGYTAFLLTNGKEGDDLRQTPDIREFYLGIENHVTIYNDNNCRIGMPYETEIVYGENAEKEGFTFTPTDFMDSYYSIWMALTVFENKVEDDDQGEAAQKTATPLGNPINIGKEVQMYKKITVLPATVVYYEDDFAGIKYTTEGTKNVITHYGDGSGSLSQSVDQNQQYGQDNAYQGSDNDEATGGSLTDILIQERSEFANFEFTGTGFEIIGHTHAVESGIAKVEVRDENGNLVADKTVITEYDNGADGGNESIVAVPILRVSGLDFGKYTVSITGVPVYDFDKWTDKTQKPPAKTSYICIDGVRIYQPLDNSNSQYENLALGMNCDAKPYSESPFIAGLTDGKYDTSYISGADDALWFGFKNTGDSATGNIDPNNNQRAVFVLNLGTEAEINSIRLHHYRGTGADPFTYINVYYSTDGTNYSFLNTINPDASKSTAYWATLNLENAVNAKYIKFALSAPTGKLVLINEIEVYGTELTKPGRNDAYIDTENGATFSEIRNLIAERQSFAIKYDDVSGLTVSGGTNTWIENRNNVLPGNREAKWTNNTVHSVNDYLLAGPNNEVYMVESTEQEKSALAFYVTEDDSHVHNMQIAVRALDYGEFVNDSKVGRVHAEIQYGAVVNDSLVWKPLTTIVSAAEQYFTIPYTECPYDAENNRYQVVIRIGDSEITGMASYTSIKLNGLKLNTLNETEVPDVIYTSEDITSTIIDSYGNTLDSSKFVDFINLTNQMNSQVVLADNTSGESAPQGVDTSALGALYHSFTADNSSDFVLTENSKIFIVAASEDARPSAQTLETAQLVQSQFMADSRPSSEPLEIVWGLEKYSAKGDIIIYDNDTTLTTAESFKLVVSDRAKVYAKDDNGLLFGLNTLQKHFRYAESNAIKGFTVQDYPQTAERTVHLDVARKYLTKNWVNNYIKEMSWMGYNALELHFSEDGGFRIDFWDPNYFQSENGNDFSWVVGSRTQYWAEDPYRTDPDAGRYLTAAELVEICNTAKLYNIEIIPSFDTPAHVDWLTWNHYNNYSSKGIYNTFKYDGTTYTLPTYLNYRADKTSEGRWACLDLGNSTVQKFSLALYKDIADFFTKYAGSKKFNIGGDEVALKDDGSDTWNYADFYNYVNTLNAMLNDEGYTVRMYNDYLGRQKYINLLPSGTTMPELAGNIEIVYWTADNPSNDSYGLKSISSWDSENRKLYNGMNYWTYYVLRIVSPTNSYAIQSGNAGRDARDPQNTWWSFYRNQEDYVYNEWNPTLMSAYNATKYTVWDSQLAGGYFMVWNDYAALNTEVEMWNGVYDKTGISGTANNYYSLIERMWSNSIKQWNWGIHNSTYNGIQTTFAVYEGLRDKLGFFPGYVKTTSGSYANACVLPTGSAASTDPYRTEYTVTFKNYDGTVIDTQVVKDGYAATAPTTIPTRPSDVWYDYTFSGWDKEFSNITCDMVVTAEYSGKATTAGKIGYLEVKVTGGTNFTMSIDGETARPMGLEYVNPAMEFGKAVTLVAQTTNGNTFVGWMDAKTGEIISTSANYSFFTSGNDVLVALYSTDIANGGLVTFRNDKTNQVIDIQYYTSNDTISFPENLAYPGYEFTGWNLTETEIKEMLSSGKDVIVSAVWQAKTVYFDIDVNGGSVTESGGMNGGSYVGYKGTIVVADRAPEGKMFAYWIDEEGNILSYSKEYKFYPCKDTTLTAVFVSNVGYEIGITDIKPLPEADTTTPTDKDTFTVYFENSWNWSEVYIYYWGVDGAPGWRGNPMTFLENNGYYDVYTYEMPKGITGMIFNGLKDDGSGSVEQSPDITGPFVDGREYSMLWDGEKKCVYNDNRVNSGTSSQADYNVFYVISPESVTANGAWFAAYGRNPDTGAYVWLTLDHISGRIYGAKLPVEYSELKIYRMTIPVGDYDVSNVEPFLSGSISPTDENNSIILNEDVSVREYGDVFEMFFVNKFGWENIGVTYTDEYGTHEAVLEFMEKDQDGNDIYTMLLPTNALRITFTDGKKTYTYVNNGNLAARSVFGFVETELEDLDEEDKDHTVNIGMDTESLGDSTVVVFDWSVIESTGDTFVNAGLLLVKEKDYIESSFVKGTIDPNVIQFTPSMQYQFAVGTHSVTITHVAIGEGWVACAFVQYRDADGVLRTKYSKQVTGKK